MLLVWPLSGHCLTRAFKKRKRNRRWTKGANEEHGARKSCETLTAERAKRLQLSCAVGLFVIPYAREAVIPSQLFFFQPRHALWPLEILSKTRNFPFGHVYCSADSHGNRINVAQGCPQTVQYFRCCTVTEWGPR